MKVLLTGAHGFLGWHTHTRLRALTSHEVMPVGRDEMARIDELLAGADAVIHIAGVNRGSEDEVETGNIELARALARPLEAAPVRVVYANSVQANAEHPGSDTPYGRGKEAAARILEGAVGPENLVDVRLPNLFGEHGRPGYNSFVATFADAVARDQAPTEVKDNKIRLLHAQQAAQVLIDGLEGEGRVERPRGTETSVVEVLNLLQRFRTTYLTGELPDLSNPFHAALFNTLRSHLFPQQVPIALKLNSDQRGWLVETVRSQGGESQTFVSTTYPGITRGEHFHLHKLERFVVLSGQARISLRRTFHDEVVDFQVSGDEPVVVDMPTLWVHNITNTGDTELITQFWTNTMFDPDNPDTFWEPVRQEDCG